MVRRWLERSLLDVTQHDHQPPAITMRRRRYTAGAFGVLGGALLGVSLRIEPGTAWFYPSTIALAAIWAVGAFSAGPIHIGRIADRTGRLRRPVASPIAIGVGLAGIFIAGALIVREINPLADQVSRVLGYTVDGPLAALIAITLVNGVAEELFFRGAVYGAITRHPVAWSTVLYSVTTLATGNIMLVFASVLLGLLVGLQRRASGGVLAPVLTHCSWSLTMLLVLPPLFGLR